MQKLHATAEREPDAVKARQILMNFKAVTQDDSTTAYTTLLTELTPNLNPNMATAEPTSSHKDTGDASKLGHNNPDEAACFLKDITQLMDRFMESISSFYRYAQEDAYPTYVFKLHKCMMELDHKYFKYASVDTVLDTIPDKWCKIFVEKPADYTEDTIQQRQSQNTLPTGHDVLTRLVHEANHKALDDASQKVVVELFHNCLMPMTIYQKSLNRSPNLDRSPTQNNSVLH